MLDKADPRVVRSVSFDDIWQLASREMSIADSNEHWHRRNVFYAIGRLVEILKDDPEVKDRMRAIVARERAVAEKMAAANQEHHS